MLMLHNYCSIWTLVVTWLIYIFQNITGKQIWKKFQGKIRIKYIVQPLGNYIIYILSIYLSINFYLFIYKLVIMVKHCEASETLFI